MKTKNIILLLILFLIFICIICGKKKYSESDFIGLSSQEIIDKYGEFDHTRSPAGMDGLYRNCACGYVVVEAKKGFLGTTPPKYFMIYFDENGIAYRCVYEEGGIGG